MIKIAGIQTSSDKIVLTAPNDAVLKEIVNTLSNSTNAYDYSSMEELQFELKLRRSLVTYADKLARGYFSFEVFTKSKCNPAFWDRTGEGGFQLKSGVLPSAAIRDIFENTPKYATECSTAMVIIYLRSLLDVMTEEQFNKLYSDIYLMNWQHLDSDLILIDVDQTPDKIPGDAGYFKNPDVNPLTPEWQGENVFYLGNDMYYGHGVGIKTPDQIIKDLNKNRIKDSNTPAYLMDFARRPDFKTLFQLKG